MEIDEWNGCYPSVWKGLIVEGAFAHPAKFSSKLIRKIYDHIAAEGWVRPGDTIVDPFGGVGLGALDAMRHGLNWRGCELEDRFVKLGNENIQFWNRKFGSMPRWSGDAVLLQGDSRLLAQVLGGAHTVVSSPPYAETEITGERNFKSAENPDGKSAKDVHRGRNKGYSATVSSPPYSDLDPRKGVERSLDFMFESYKRGGGLQTYEQFCATQMKHSEGYSLEGSYGGLDTSPPYADSINSENGIDLDKLGTHGPNTQAGQVTRYGIQSAQLGAMKSTDKGFQASISSPPFLQSEGGHPEPKEGGPIDKALYDRHNAGNKDGAYGETGGQLSADSYDDFWLSARAIVEQVYQVLQPGAHAVWVTKRYVKDKKVVEFTEQWIKMCEAVGFTTLHIHRAMLVEYKGTSIDFDGVLTTKTVKRASFFRRLAEKKGSPAIDWEDVVCMQKPMV